MSVLMKKWIKSEEEGLRSHKAVLKLLARVKAASMLDVGCEKGGKTLAYAAALGIPAEGICGIEAQEVYAGEARKKFAVHKVDLESEPFPFRDSSFDLVVCNQVLEHLKNIFLPLSEMARVLKPGGHLLIGVPNMAGLYNRLLLAVGRQPLANSIDGPHVRGFAHAPFLEFLLANPDFELAGLGASNLYPLPYPLLDALCGKFPGLSSFAFYLLKKRSGAIGCGWRHAAAQDTVF